MLAVAAAGFLAIVETGVAAVLVGIIATFKTARSGGQVGAPDAIAAARMAAIVTAGVIIDTTAPNNPGGYVSTNSLATTIGL